MNKSKLEEFVLKGYSTHEIAKEIGISQTNTCYWLKKFALKTARSKNSNPYSKIFYCINCGKIKEEHRSNTNKYCSIRCQQDYQRSQLTIDDYKTDRSRREFLIRERGHQCEECKYTEWNKKPIPLELEHFDGNHENNTLENLKLLCPNCHAQTPTYKNKNKGNGRESRHLRYKKIYKDPR